MVALEGIKDLWMQYYPTIMTAITMVSVAVGVIYAVWSKIKPILDNVNDIKDNLAQKDATDVTDKLKSIELETKITDLKAKLENPTISDELKQNYTQQLTQLLEIKAQLDAGLAKTEETLSKY